MRICKALLTTFRYKDAAGDILGVRVLRKLFRNEQVGQVVPWYVKRKLLGDPMDFQVVAVYGSDDA